MTEQEAEALAARLVRIWAVPHQNEWWWDMEEDLNGEVFLCVTHLSASVAVSFSKQEDRSLAIGLAEANMSLFVDPSGRLTTEPSEITEETRSFVAQWLSVFRRGCWLSGCPIDASAHEKAEWMQGFSQKELEAWNLKF